ncbi:hypothetical protein ACTFIV_005722 [Dictyostelium citrinum]
MKKIIIFFVFICLISSWVSAEQLLGEIEINEKSLSIDASVIDAKINYLIDNTITKPKLLVTSISGETEILQISGDKKSLTFGDYSSSSSGGGGGSSNTISGSNKLVRTTNSLILISFSTIITFGLFNNHSRSAKSSLLFLFLVLVFISTLSNSIRLSEVSVRIDIKVPSTFKFDSLLLTLGSGSSKINGLIASSLTIDGCKDHSIELNQISISSQLNVCSTKDININEIQLSSTNVKLNLTSSSNVNIDFNNGYSGTFSINTDELTLDSACEITKDQNTGIVIGSCNGGGDSKLSITAITGKTVISNAEITCPIDNGWRVTVGADIVPLSPSIISSQPATDFIFKKNDLVYMAAYGYSNESITDGPVENSFIVSIPIYIPPSNFLVSKIIGSPTFKANVKYQFSIFVKLGQPLGAFNRIQNMSLYFFNPRDITDPINGASQYYELKDTTIPLFVHTFEGNFTSNTDFTKTTIEFTPTVDIGTSIFALRIFRTGFTGGDVVTIIIKDMKFTILPRTTTQTTLLTKDSELVHLPKPSTSFDPQDSITCPYLANDLVHWHNPSTWPNGIVPSPSSNITLPVGKKVLISPCSVSKTQVYQWIKVPPTSELIFSDAPMDFNVKDIYVEGKFIMGTTKCRYNSKINLIFHGEKTLSDTISQYYGSKGIGVSSSGFISVHGKQYHNTWSKLAASAWSGDYVVYIQDNVNWEVGQKVVVITSYYQDEDNNQNEVMTIAAIQGKTIQFTEPLKFFHYGGQEYQAEIALLSRRITFQSSDVNQFGGHVMVMGEGQFAGLALIRMGQRNIKARYPLHYHLGKVLKNSYISDCSVTNSYYRCYTIHGTNNVTLTRNVAFDVSGHCYYLEDGVEMDNTLSFNLAAYVHPIGRPAAGPSQIGEVFVESDNLRQPADCAASGYYITNAWNTIIGNTASGGWAGYAFPNLDKPIGNHRTVQMIPKAYTTKVFEGNTGHSSGHFFITGATIYVGANLTYNEVDGLLYYDSGRFERFTYKNGTVVYGNEVPMRFNNTKIYLSNFGLGHWGEYVEVVTYESHDNIRSASIFGEAWLSNAIVNGNSNNIARSINFNKQGFQFYDTYVKTVLSNISFRNYIRNPKSLNDEDDNRAIISMTHGDVFKPQGISAARAISFVNVANSQTVGHQVLPTSGSRYFNFIDWDSSITAKKPGQPALVGSHELWYKFDNTCEYNSDWTCHVCEKGNKEIANIQFIIPGLIDDGVLVYDSFENLNIGNISLFGSGITDRRSTIVTKNQGVTGVSNMGWYLYLKAGSPKSMKIWLSQVVFGQHIFLAVPYPTQTSFVIKSNYIWGSSINYNHAFSLASSAADVRSGNGTKYFFDGNFLYVKLVNLVLTGDPSEYYERDGVKVYWVRNSFSVSIEATNTVTPPTSDGFFKNLPDNLPSSSL